MTRDEAMQQRVREIAAQESVRILALETSCDETAAAVIENGRTVKRRYGKNTIAWWWVSSRRALPAWLLPIP